MQSGKSRDTWSNRHIWPWSTEWCRAKVYRVLPRERTGHSKHPLPTTQENTLHMDITRWSTPKSDWLYSLQPKMEKLYTFATQWTASRQASLSITNSQSLLELMSIKSVMPSNHLILCHPLFLPPSIFPSIRVFSNEPVRHIRLPTYWSFRKWSHSVVSNSLQPHGLQLTRLLRLWDFPGRSTGVGCHCLLQLLHSYTSFIC